MQPLIWLAMEIFAEVTALLPSQEHLCTIITADLLKPEAWLMYNPRNGMPAVVNYALLLCSLTS